MILITGVSGFIGRHLLKAMVSKYGSEMIHCISSKPNDLCDYSILKNHDYSTLSLSEEILSKVTTLVHVGAFTPKNGGEASLIDENNSNITNTHLLLNQKFKSLRKLIFFSTLDVYAPSIKAISEESKVDPISLYAASKLYGEKLVQTFAQNNGLECQILRIGHIYGPGEEIYRKLIPETFKNILNKQSVMLINGGSDLRTFLYIDDAVTAILNSLDRDNLPPIINIAGGETLSIKSIIDEMIKVSELNCKIEEKQIDGLTQRDIEFKNDLFLDLLNAPLTEFSEGLKQEWNHLKQI